MAIRFVNKTELSKPSTVKAGGLSGFSLIELLVVTTIIVLLISILLPSLKQARLQARIVKTHHDLRQITVALDSYSMNHKDQFPPTRVGCSEWIWFQLPFELATDRYLPKKPGRVKQADLNDEFDPDHTYKYRAPGMLIMNEGSLVIENGSYIWVPDNYPNCTSNKGEIFYDPSKSPVRYAVWSMGPDPMSPKFPMSSLFGKTTVDEWDFPLKQSYWYMRAGDTGVITHSKHRKGLTYISP